MGINRFTLKIPSIGYEQTRELEVKLYKFSSSYIYDVIKKEAEKIVPNIKDKSSVVYQIYNAIISGELENPEILVVKDNTSELAVYNEDKNKILVSENTLDNIEDNHKKKLKLFQDLANSFSNYMNSQLDINTDGIHICEYDFYHFDCYGNDKCKIGDIETPNFDGDLMLNFEQEPILYASIEEGATLLTGPPFDGLPNFGIKLRYRINGGFSMSLYADIQKELSRSRMKVGNDHTFIKADTEFVTTASLNAALTFYRNTPGTSKFQKNLCTFSLTPQLTMGTGTGEKLDMNMFNQYVGTSLMDPREFSFSFGQSYVLSSGYATKKHKINKDGKLIRVKDPMNSADYDHRHQMIGAFSIKFRNVKFSMYNDIFKFPLFFGMNSDQYWSAGHRLQLAFPNESRVIYAGDMYYGKSNNKATKSYDKIIEGQNYDFQTLCDLLLNRGYESIEWIGKDGELLRSTGYAGYSTFWGSNMVHDGIINPNTPPEPKKPTKPKREDYDNESEYDKEFNLYKLAIRKYKDLYIEYLEKLNDIWYQTTINTFKNPSFHHLYVVYNKDNKIDFHRVLKYNEAGRSLESEKVRDFLLLEQKLKK